MHQTNSGDPAFVGPTTSGFADGLTKLEYFAGQQMQALANVTGHTDLEKAVRAVSLAKALIEELNKPQ